MVAADTVREVDAPAKRCGECGARFGADAAFCPFDGQPLVATTWSKASDPRTRLVVDGRYEVLEPIGEGGMGTVYRVRHVSLNRHFAMKVLRRDLAGDLELAARFLREARATAAIKHPSIVAINDFGEIQEGPLTIPWFVMELLDGETLATRIRARGPLPPSTATLVARQIAEALAASHDAGVVHRDLKPDNVFLVGPRSSAETDIRIVDFGAAKIIGESKLTRPGIVFGTPYYMSPEQASGEPIDGRADVYALGVLLYEMVTGKVPFDADTYMGVLTKHMFEAPRPPEPPPGIRLGALEDVILRALAKNPDARWPSMAAMAKALTTAAPESGRPHIDAVTIPRLTRAGTVETIERSVAKHEASERRRRVATVALVVFAAGVAFAVGVVVMAPPTGPAAPTTAARATGTTTAAAPRTTHTTALPPPAPTEPATAPAATLAVPASTTTAAATSATTPPPTVTNAAVGPEADAPARPRPRPSTAKAPADPAPPPTHTATSVPNSPDNFKDPWTR